MWNNVLIIGPVCKISAKVFRMECTRNDKNAKRFVGHVKSVSVFCRE